MVRGQRGRGYLTRPVIGHCDWLASNARWKGGELLVVHDWGSTAADSESVLAGFAAASHSTASGLDAGL